MKNLLALSFACCCLLFAGCESSFVISGFEVVRDDEATSMKLADLAAKCDTSPVSEKSNTDQISASIAQ